MRAEQLYARLPMSFEENKGQVDPTVKFLSRAAAQTIFLTSTEAVFSIRRRDNQMSEKQDSEPIQPNEIHPFNPREVNETVFRMKMVGANASPSLTGIDELPGKTNYLKGSNPNNWRKNVANYAKVKYQEVYPGIDMVYYGNQRQLEYDLIVKPGTNPNRIRLSFEPGKALVDRSGDLMLRANSAELRQHQPIAYQEVNGSRKSVTAKYAIRSNGNVSFTLGKYRRDMPLIIDPVLTFASYLGGSDKDLANAISVDSSGAVYLAGATRSSDFPTAGSLKPAPGFFEFDAFVTKLDPTGSALVYSTYLGGSHSDSAAGIKVDGSGAAVVVGSTDSSEFPGTHTFQTNPGGSSDAFVLKLSPDGSSLIYSIGIGGSSSDQASSLALDSSGNVYLTGTTSSTDFPLVNELSGQTGDPNVNAFIVKLNQAGDSLLYSTYLGGTSFDEGKGIAVDSAGNAYVTGFTTSPNFPTVNSLRQSVGGPCFKTTNAGSHWGSASAGIASADIASLAISQTNPSIVFAIDGRGTAIYKSTDSGANWNAVIAPNTNNHFRAVAVDPTTPSIVYASNVFSVMKSTDGGSTWAFSGSGLNSGSILTIAIRPGRPSELFAGATPPAFPPTQLFKSTDSGATWVPSNTGLLGSITSVAFGSSGANTVYAGGPNHVYKSTNGGDSWTQISSRQSNMTPLVVDPSNSSVVYFGAFEGVFKSTDGGSSFIRTGFELTGRVDAMVMDPQNPTILYAGGASSGDVFKTTDAGASWMNVSQGLTYGNVVALAIDASTPSILYLGGSAVTDAFVVKLTLPSSGLTYSTLLGGRHDDLGKGIAVDDSGNAYVAGTTFSNDFPSINAYQPTFAGDLDIFVTKLNASGSALIYSTFIGGNNEDDAAAIAVDSSGNIYVSGYTRSTNFPVFNAVQTSLSVKRDAFIVKLGPGGLPVYSTYLGGSDDDLPSAVAFDSNGAAYIAGTTASTNFPATAGSLQTTFGGGEQDAFVAKITPSALTLDAYSKAFAANGGSGAVNVSGPPSATWTAISNDSWITIDNPGPGSGDGTFSYSVDSNPSASPRVGTITIADLMFKVLQGVAFNDVPPDMLFYDEIGKLSANGITSGCGSGQFCPNAPVTREQMAAFLIRALGDPNPTPFFNQRFSDVPQSSPFAPFIEQMAARQITFGCGGDKYCPSQPVLREQMAAFILRALGEFSPPLPSAQRFNDVAPSNLFYNFIDRMAVLNITAGCSQSPPLYCPSESVTRAQMAAFLVRAFKL